MPLRTVRSLAVVLGLASAGASVSAPTPTPIPTPTPTTAPAERIEVRLAQLDVVVRNKSGKLVTGLRAEDFAVFEDGSPMEIVAVDEWGVPTQEPSMAYPQRVMPSPEPQAEPATKSTASVDQIEPERRSFVLVFDALGSSTALRMSQAKQAAKKFVRNHFRSDDLAAVYQLDLSLRAVTGVTSSADQIIQGIDHISWMAASSLQDEIAESVLSYGGSGTNPLMQQRLSGLSVNAAQQLDWQREHIYSALNGLASLFRGLPGRRVLVLASPGFPMTTAGDAKTGSGGFTPKFRDLIRSLAAYGVTVYSLDIGNDLAMGDASEKIDWRIAVGKVGMDENVLSDLGLERSMGTNTASSRREFLGVIAAESGGQLLLQTDLSKAFDTIEEESTRFYRISCRVPVMGTGERYRKLRVQVKTPGFVVSSRRGRYSDITPMDRTPTSGVASLGSLDRYRPLTTRGIALPLPGSDPKKVPVEVVIEALGPVELPIDAQGGAALDVEFLLVARAEGEVVDRYTRSFTARVKPDGVGAIRKAFRVDGRLSLVPGIYEIQGTVRVEAPPQLASWSSTVAVLPPPKGVSPAFVAVVVNAENQTEAPLLSRPPIPDESDPLVLKPGARILPTTQADFDTGGSLLVLYWLRGFPDAGEEPPPLDLSLDVADGDGHVVTLPTKVLFFGKERSGGYRAVTRVDAAALTAGTYTLHLSASLRGSEGPPARQSVPFTLRAKAASPSATSASAESP